MSLKERLIAAYQAVNAAEPHASPAAAQDKLAEETALAIGEHSSGTTAFSVNQANQPSEGFSILNVVRVDVISGGSEWVLAKADLEATIGTHVIVDIGSGNEFIVAQSGRFVVGSHGLTVGSRYYLSEIIDGLLTLTEPTTGFSNLLILVESSDVIHVLPYRYSVANSGKLILLGSAIADNDVSVAFTSGFSDRFSHYVIKMEDIHPQTGDTVLRLRVSTNGGSSYINGAGTYTWAVQGSDSQPTAHFTGDPSDTEFQVHSGAANWGLSIENGMGLTGIVRIANMRKSEDRTQFLSHIAYWRYASGSGVIAVSHCAGSRLSSTVENAIQFRMESGNIVTGEFYLYGEEEA